MHAQGGDEPQPGTSHATSGDLTQPGLAPIVEANCGLREQLKAHPEFKNVMEQMVKQTVEQQGMTGRSEQEVNNHGVLLCHWLNHCLNPHCMHPHLTK